MLNNKKRLFLLLIIFSFLFLFIFCSVGMYILYNFNKKLENNFSIVEKNLHILSEQTLKEFESRKTRDSIIQKQTDKMFEKIFIIEESLDPSNTRWVKIKKIRSVVRKVIEDKHYVSNLKTDDLTAYASAVVDWSEIYDVPVPLILAMTQQESGFNSKVKSSAGAIGMIQLMPSTAKEIAGDLGIRHYNLYKIRDNVQFGVFYIMKLLDEFDGNIAMAVRAYNCGPTYVHKVLAGEYKDYPPETRKYVNFILGTPEFEGYMKHYESMGF